MKIVVTPTSFRKAENNTAIKLLESFASEIVYNETGTPLRGEELVRLMDGADGYIAGLDYIDADVVAKFPDTLKIISRYGAGVDRVDIPACAKKGIIVTNTPGANAIAVAELAFGLMLSVARNITRLDIAVQKGEWPRSAGIELAGKTLGIVGLGAIGKKIATRANAFEMDVCAYDPYFDEKFAEINNMKKVSLDELLTLSDFVTLHLPITKETRHIINKNRIKNMKQGAVIINTARGGLIDEQAAVQAVIDGKLGGLGLDAFEEEPLKDSPLKNLSNVVLTPHTGAHTAEAMQKMSLMAVQNIIDVLSGEKSEYAIKA